MSKPKLSPEQKEYLNSIESKKKRKKLKKEFLFNNDMEAIFEMAFQPPKRCRYVVADGINLHEFDTKADDFINTDKSIETKYSLADLRNTFYTARQMKSGKEIGKDSYHAVYYYDSFNDFLKDL